MLLRIFPLNDSCPSTSVPVANGIFWPCCHVNPNVGPRICMPRDQFYYFEHRVVTFVFLVIMAPYVLCIYTFYVLLEVEKRGQISKLSLTQNLPAFLETACAGRPGSCSCYSGGVWLPFLQSCPQVLLQCCVYSASCKQSMARSKCLWHDW